MYNIFIYAILISPIRGRAFLVPMHALSIINSSPFLLPLFSASVIFNVVLCDPDTVEQQNLMEQRDNWIAHSGF